MPTQSLTIRDNLLTTGGDDPLLPQLIHAINHATEIEIAVSFIQPSGLDLLLPSIHEAIERKQSHQRPLKLRILTSDYLHITHPIALRSLVELDGDDIDVKIFEANNRSFHLKSYIFVRSDEPQTFFNGTAFVGSNNISKSALTDAHEWCLRLDYHQPDNSPSAIQFRNIREQFNKLFQHPRAIPLTDEWIDAYIKRRTPPKLSSIGDSTLLDDDAYSPNPAQLEALEALNQTRDKGNVRGLVVMGTGMGKTWLSAFDAKQMNAKRVLFVAHREEILTQALNTFAKLWPEKSAGYYNGKTKEQCKDMVFASVQSLGRIEHLSKFEPDYFDYIVVDEFHHASAKTYLNILNHFEPRFLLGLTATPERTDQANILSLCHDNLVFERNLVHGIDGEILVPFHYFGIWDDSVDYQEIPWRNGKFDPAALDAQFATTRRAKHIFKHWQNKQQSRTLAFCISKKHADFMAEQFNASYAAQGFKALSVHSDSSVRRNEALTMLDNGDIQILFSVDLFNEGTDLPSIDTVLMLRPTESNIIFLQQLGRGLRRHSNKTHLVVLDFIGNHRSFLNKREILGITDAKLPSFHDGSDTDSPQLGKGCFVNIDPQIVEFWQELTKQLRYSAKEEFENLTSHLGHRPRAVEFYRAGYDFNKVNKQHGGWLELVATMNTTSELQQLVDEHKSFFLNAIQKMSMTKCFKAILLEAYLELDGFNTPPSIEALSAKSWHVLSRYPQLKASDLSDKIQQLESDSPTWQKYWRDNPINAFVGGNTKKENAWFTNVDGKLVANFTVKVELVPHFHDFVKELVDLQLAKYADREQKKVEPLPTPKAVNDGTMLPYYPNLKIACGHFKTGTSDDVEFMPIDISKVTPDKHFLARASGNSMNGGKSPIVDGDLLLLEFVTPTSAGSITGNTMAVEIQGDAGDNQYLLRVVQKDAQGQYWLKANNPDYAVIPANDSMKTFARLKQIIREYT
ncbi:Type III restriction protein res subunit [Vibrio sp. B1REV9]|uniref:DEAD/DEAH box helicase family protein n=1 Tax=Vibrio sp. B1REV9 TaxID=2751179 RepID=UPI001AFC957E|nr:DEAD/DEAH box helicase family protein [Vibrio sp. B1REV9]CAE6901017.1 Type III restriction protein res subunit [Vibrio sp. B1REV9]